MAPTLSSVYTGLVITHTPWIETQNESNLKLHCFRKKIKAILYSLLAVVLALVSCTTKNSPSTTDLAETQGAIESAWLSGDHHIHSRYSVGWNLDSGVPKPIIGGDAIYPTAMNARMARHHNLSWMVTTDLGGPKHCKVLQCHLGWSILANRNTAI